MASGAERKLGGKAEAMPHNPVSKNYVALGWQPTCPTEQQSRGQITGDKIASATNPAQIAKKTQNNVW